MSGRITLHPKYGVNPTLGVCFWCGGDDGTIGLLGLNKGREAPRRAIISAEPCPKCKENMALGITVIEANKFQAEPWQPQIAPDTFPTGRWCVVDRDAAFWNSVTEPLRTQIMATGKCVLEPELYNGLGFGNAHAEAKRAS